MYHLPMAWDIRYSVCKWFTLTMYFVRVFFFEGREYIMKLEQGYSDHIKNEFFELINDKNLMSNKENSNYRPHYCALKDSKNQQLYWMIPISSKVDKYKNIIEKKIEKYGSCDTICLGYFAGDERAYLLQNAFPIKEEYIDHIHTVNNMPIRIHKQLEEKLESMLNKLISLKNKGINMFFTDIDIIRKKIEEI